MIDYNAKEKRAISAAWAGLEYLADCAGSSTSHQLEWALKYEKTERGLAIARAVLVSCAEEAMRDYRDGKETALRDLAGYSIGCLVAKVQGAALAHAQNKRDGTRPGDPHASHDAYLSRRFHEFLGLADVVEQCREARSARVVESFKVGASA